MSTEIKIVQNPIKQAVTNLQSATQDFESSFTDKIEGENHLDLLEQLNQLNRTYSSLIKFYQSLLLEHINATENSVETLIETDQSIGEYLTFYK
ncbi:YwqI/YxiC family protein [Lentibacillus sp. Marseille-P4043]|uniref:YwqI/YxiC family protein n=1 Tax=Lentibacillus sp. Marseille-P4043 TaxID=2040293 RepID=UPI000D0B8B74|nr:YwqI/YxiC family protein [Lentibacillus sp. Marseille-P4043]